jgi:hypothetical protein
LDEGKKKNIRECKIADRKIKKIAVGIAVKRVKK